MLLFSSFNYFLVDEPRGGIGFVSRAMFSFRWQHILSTVIQFSRVAGVRALHDVGASVGFEQFFSQLRLAFRL